MLLCLMFPSVVKTITTPNKVVVFLDSKIFRCASYVPKCEVFNVKTHDGLTITTTFVSPWRFSAFLKSKNKEMYWHKKIKYNKKYKTVKRNFGLEERLGNLFEK